MNGWWECMTAKKFRQVSPEEASKSNTLLTQFFTEPQKSGRKKRKRGRPKKQQVRIDCWIMMIALKFLGQPLHYVSLCLQPQGERSQEPQPPNEPSPPPSRPPPVVVERTVWSRGAPLLKLTQVSFLFVYSSKQNKWPYYVRMWISSFNKSE